MNRMNISLTDICNRSAHTIKDIQTTSWRNRKNYLTLLFVLTTIMMMLFCYYHLSQRHFVLIGSKQKQINDNLSSDINNLQNLTSRLNTLKSIQKTETINEQLISKAQRTEDPQIIHSVKLLENCNKTWTQDNELLIQYIEGIQLMKNKFSK